tara:strand:+ start:254 stop:637 length:384 start_codon:yes stop_codon:yes gene_type:complete
MNFLNAVKSYFVRWNDFKTRSSRSEYWWATLFSVLGSLALELLNVAIASNPPALILTISILVLIFLIFMMIASLALAVRRLHDLDKSGWWYLLVFTIIGIIPLTIWFCSKGTEGENRFGENPLSKNF